MVTPFFFILSLVAEPPALRRVSALPKTALRRFPPARVGMTSADYITRSKQISLPAQVGNLYLFELYLRLVD